MNWYVDVLKNYTGFDGRARRQEFWMFTLISTVISMVINVAASAAGAGAVAYVYSVAVLLPTLAVGCRRLHDTNRSGWWQLIGIIPVIGWIVIIVFWATDGQPDTNKYGANPKALGFAA